MKLTRSLRSRRKENLQSASEISRLNEAKHQSDLQIRELEQQLGSTAASLLQEQSTVADLRVEVSSKDKTIDNLSQRIADATQEMQADVQEMKERLTQQEIAVGVMVEGQRQSNITAERVLENTQAIQEGQQQVTANLNAISEQVAVGLSRTVDTATQQMQAAVTQLEATVMADTDKILEGQRQSDIAIGKVLESTQALEEGQEQMQAGLHEMDVTVATGFGEISEGQQRTETELGRLSEGQQQMQASLKDMNTQIASLQEEIQGSIAATQETNNSLRSAIEEHLPDNQKLLATLDSLNKQLTQAVSERNHIQQQLAALKDDEAKESSQRLEEFRQQLASLENTIAGIKSGQQSVDDAASSALASSNREYGQITNARIEITNDFEDNDRIFAAQETFTSYSVVVQRATGQEYILSLADSIGLKWGEFDDGLKKFNHLFAKRGDNPVSGSYQSLSPLNSVCRVTAITIDKTIPSSLKLYKSIEEIADPRVSERMYLYSHKERTTFSRVDPNAVKFVFQGNLINFDTVNYSLFLQFNAGDFVITDDGHLVGIMTDKETCQIIVESDLDNLGTSFTLSDKDRFAEEVLKYQESCLAQ